MDDHETDKTGSSFKDYMDEQGGFDGMIRRAFPLATETTEMYITGGSDGWEEIILEGLGQIEEELEKNPVPFSITDIKSKYGILRLYYNGGNDEIEEIVETMMLRSATTCERCGGLGRLMGKGWVYTACRQHRRGTNEHTEDT